MSVIVYPEDVDFDEGSMAAIRGSNQVKTIVKTMQDWAIREPKPAPRRLHLHFLHKPVEILGTDRVTGIRTERTRLTGDGNVAGTGEFVTTPVQAVYRAVGYRSTPLPGLGFDAVSDTVPHDAGRVLDAEGFAVRGVYTTGWVKRGPVGLIGHTKGDALETVTSLLADSDKLVPAAEPDPAGVLEFLGGRGVAYTTWEGWQLLDIHEQALGAAVGRERIKVVPREEMIRVSRP